MEKLMMVFSMLLRMSRRPSRMAREPEVPLTVMPTRTRLASLLGGMGRFAKVYWGNL